MENIRQNIILRFLWLVVTLCIFNWSVDAPDAQYYCISEDAGNDDIESIVEIVLEQVVDVNDSVSEKYQYDKINNFIVPNLHLKIPFPKNHLVSDKFAQYKEQYCEHFCPEIVPRPPKV